MTDPYMDYMWQHPPRAVKDLARPLSGALKESLHPDDDMTVFELVCQGSHETFAVTTQIVEGTHGGRVEAVCSECGEDHDVFDPETDGYDGEKKLGIEWPGESVSLQCAACMGEVFQIAVKYRYAGANEGLDEADDIEHRQDFFQWFELIVRCPGCNRVTEVSSIECA